jgi:hypothetical protein
VAAELSPADDAPAAPSSLEAPSNLEASSSLEAPSNLEGGAVLYRCAGSTAEITLNRPEALNAINGAVHRGIHEGLERAVSDDAVRVVVIRGSGRAFSAGGDLVAVAAGEDVGHPATLGRAIWSLAKPVIAAVHGYCLGQACELAAVCDLTVAAESATFGEVEINHGWGPPLPVTPYALGLKRAKEVLLLGEIVQRRAGDADRPGQPRGQRRGTGRRGSQAHAPDRRPESRDCHRQQAAREWPV